ncbi:MAG: ATP dependent DNA ligase, partial [Armatimonadota bacterium]
MNIVAENRCKPLGKGQFFYAGSVGDSQITEIVSSYKRDIAGAYTSVACDAIRQSVPDGRHHVSTKVDGEQWFLFKDVDGAFLISPNGKVITSIEVTEEANSILQGWTGLLAGELYVAVDTGRPRVYGLHSILGSGIDADTSRIRFAVFDLLLDGDNTLDDMPFPSRVHRMKELLSNGNRIHMVNFTQTDNPDDLESFFNEQTRDYHAEGIVVRCDDGRVFKIKPDISIDAAIVGYTASEKGINDLLLGLMTGNGDIQLIGHVDIGFSDSERKEIADRLTPLSCESSLHLSNRNGIPYTWVAPTMVVEVTCHELLTHKADGEHIRRPRITYSADIGWNPLGKHQSISMRDAVFIRMRDDKSINSTDLRWSQVTDIAPIGITESVSLPASEIIRREVYAKRSRSGGMAIRKLLVWKTNKGVTDSRYPAYAVMFTDYSPSRIEPLQTELKTASTLEKMMSVTQEWLDVNTGRGWECMASMGIEMPDIVVKDSTKVNILASPHVLSISFARSTSPTFPIVRKRLDGFTDIGEVIITTDESGKESWFELRITGGIIEHFRRITNMVSIIRRWKSMEISLNGETLDKYAIDDTINRIAEIRKCWML